MAHGFGSLVFTPVIKALQERYGSSRVGPQESAFTAERDSFYMAGVGETGWPYVQHRGGPKGFLKVIDDS